MSVPKYLRASLVRQSETFQLVSLFAALLQRISNDCLTDLKQLHWVMFYIAWFWIITWQRKGLFRQNLHFGWVINNRSYGSCSNVKCQDIFFLVLSLEKNATGIIISMLPLFFGIMKGCVIPYAFPFKCRIK